MRVKILFLMLILFSLLNANQKMIVRLSNPVQKEIKYLYQNEYDVVSFVPHKYIDIIINKDELDFLKRNSFDFAILQTKDEILKNLHSDDFRLDGYRDYESLLSELQQLSNDYSDICSLHDIGDSQGKLYFEQGNDVYEDFNHEIWALKISDNVNENEDEPCFYYMSEHHAREPISLEVVMNFTNELLTNYGYNPQITDRINNSEIWIIPLVNPNGHKVVTDETNIWWRKNIRDNNENGVMNVGNYGEDGVDPNRNYGWQWGNVGASSSFTGETYHGLYAWSEPENIAVKNLLDSRPFVAGISYHSYGELVLYPFGYGENVIAPDQTALSDLAVQMANTIPSLTSGNYTPQAAWELYPCMGTSDDYSYGEHGSFAYTIELAQEFIPSASQIQQICDNNLEAPMIMLDRITKSTLTGFITDSTTNQPIVAEIFVETIDNTGVERNPYLSNSEFGRFYRMLMPGNYSITFSAFGYESITIENVEISEQENTTLNVSLQASEFISLSGLVRDAESGDAISGAVINFVDTPIDEIMTDANGEFTLDQIPVGIYSVVVSAENFGLMETNVDLTNSNYIVLNMASLKIFDDMEQGIDNWEVDPNSWAFTTNEKYSGDFSLTDSPNGNYSNNIDKKCKFSQILDLTEIDELSVSFYTKFDIESDYDFCYFEVSTNPSSSNEWDTIASFTGISDWQKQELNLNQYCGFSTIGFRFRMKSDGGVVGDGIYLDDFAIYYAEIISGNDSKEFQKISSTLQQNYPNPFFIESESRSNLTNISFSISENSLVDIQIFNIKGQLVKSYDLGKMEIGTHYISWNGKDENNQIVASGVYLYKLSTKNSVLQKKMMLIK